MPISEALDIHPASDAERLAAYRNVYDVWSRGRSLREHVAQRLKSPRHNRARWFVGCLDGEVVTSLGVFTLSYRVHGRTVAGIAIGGVHTMKEYRGRGFAPRLMDWVEMYHAERGARLSVLFSDIDPGYYARIGYLRCPAVEGWACPQQSAASPAEDVWALAAFSGQRERDRMAQLYAAHHASSAIWIERDRDYWKYTLAQQPQDEFYWLAHSTGEPAGYVRFTPTGAEWKIADFALQPDSLAGSPGHEETLYRQLIQLAGRRGVRRVGGWLPDTTAARTCFTLAPRSVEITMIKALGDECLLNGPLIAATSRFCEIDHV